MHEPQRMSFEEFECLEEGTEGKIEFHDGDVVVMEGPSLDHETIVTNVGDLIAAAVRSRGCRRFTGASIATPDRRYAFRPDLAVTCDERDLGPGDHRRKWRLSAPCFVLEVLSPSTARVDLTDKLVAYMKVDSLETYLVVDSRRKWALAYLREPSGSMRPTAIESELPTPHGLLTLDAIYDGVHLPILGSLLLSEN